MYGLPVSSHLGLAVQGESHREGQKAKGRKWCQNEDSCSRDFSSVWFPPNPTDVDEVHKSLGNILTQEVSWTPFLRNRTVKWVIFALMVLVRIVAGPGHALQLRGFCTSWAGCSPASGRTWGTGPHMCICLASGISFILVLRLDSLSAGVDCW